MEEPNLGSKEPIITLRPEDRERRGWKGKAVYSESS